MSSIDSLYDTGVLHHVLSWVSVQRDLGAVAEACRTCSRVVEAHARYGDARLAPRENSSRAPFARRVAGCKSAKSSRRWGSKTSSPSRSAPWMPRRRGTSVPIAAAERRRRRYALGFGGRRAWRCILRVYSRCVVWLRADACVSVDGEDNIVAWRDALGGKVAALPASTLTAPRLLDNCGRRAVAFGDKPSSARGLVLGGPGLPPVADGVMLVVAAVRGDSTVVDSSVPGDRFELCHGYPTDGDRAHPRICFTATSLGDPPRHALWGNTRATGAWHVYTTVFGHASWRPPPPRAAAQPPDERWLRARGGLLTAVRRRLHNSAALAAPPGLPFPGAAPVAPARSAALFVDGAIEGCANVGPNFVAQGLTIGSDRNGSYRLRGDVAEFALWSGPVPASCLLALEHALLKKHKIESRAGVRRASNKEVSPLPASERAPCTAGTTRLSHAARSPCAMSPETRERAATV